MSHTFSDLILTHSLFHMYVPDFVAFPKYLLHSSLFIIFFVLTIQYGKIFTIFSHICRMSHKYLHILLKIISVELKYILYTTFLHIYHIPLYYHMNHLIYQSPTHLTFLHPSLRLARRTEHFAGASHLAHHHRRLQEELHAANGCLRGPHHRSWLPLHLLRQPVPPALLQLWHRHRWGASSLSRQPEWWPKVSYAKGYYLNPGARRYCP